MGIREQVEAWDRNRDATPTPTPEYEQFMAQREDGRIIPPAFSQGQANPVSTEDYKSILANFDEPRADGETVNVPTSVVGQRGERPRDVRFHDGDTVFVGPESFRSDSGNSTEAFTPTGQAARAVALQATRSVQFDPDGDGGYGRGKYSTKNSSGEDVLLDQLRLGVATPMDKFVHDDGAAAAAMYSGYMRQAVGLPRTFNQDLAGAQQAVDDYKQAHEWQAPDHYTGDVMFEAHRRGEGILPAFEDALSRGVDTSQAGLGGVAEYIGEKTGLDGVAEYGKRVREDNSLESAYNKPEVGSLEDISQAKSLSEKVSRSFTYAAERLGEGIPQAGTDLALGAAGTAIGGPALGAGLLAASGGVQSLGAEQVRMKEAGIKDTGLAPLANAVVGAGLNVVTDMLPLQAFTKAIKEAGVDDGVARSAMQIAKDSMAAVGKTTAVGAGVGGAVGAVQNTIEQSLFLAGGGNDLGYDLDTVQTLDGALSGILAGGSTNAGAHVAAGLYRQTGRFIRQYMEVSHDADLMAAEKDVADEQVNRKANASLDPNYADIHGAVAAELNPKVTPTENKATVEDVVNGTGATDAKLPSLAEIFGGMDEQPTDTPTPDAPVEPAAGTTTEANPTPSPVEPTSEVAPTPDIVQQPEQRTAAGFGNLHALNPSDIPNLTSDRHAVVDKLMTKDDGSLVDVRTAKQLVDNGLLSEHELVSYLADDLSPKANVIFSRLDQRVVNQQLRSMVEEAAAQFEPKRRLAERSGSERDWATELTLQRAENAMQGKYEVNPDAKDPKQRFQTREFSDDHSRLREENEVLRNALKQLGYSTDEAYTGAHDYHASATLQRAIDDQNSAVVPAPKEEPAAPTRPSEVKQEVTPRPAFDAPVDLNNYEQVFRSLYAHGLKAMPAIEKAIGALDDATLQKMFAQYNRERLADTSHARTTGSGHDDLVAELNKFVAAQIEKVKQLPPEQRKEAGQNIVTQARTFMETALKDGYREAHRRIEDAKERELRQAHRDYNEGEAFTYEQDIPADSPEMLSGQEADATVAPHYTRRTAYARSALDQLGKMLGVDTQPLMERYLADILPEEKGHKLEAGDARASTVQVVQKGGVGGLTKANRERIRADASTEPDVHQIPRIQLARIKKYINDGRHDLAYDLLSRRGVLPKEVDHNGKSVERKSFWERVMVPSKMQQKTSKDLLHGLVVDRDGNHSATAVDVQKVTEHGLRELGYMKENGDWDLQGQSLPRALSEAFAHGFSALTEPENGMAFQIDPYRKLSSDQVIWRDKSAPDNTFTYGDVENNLRRVFSSPKAKDLDRVHDMTYLRDEQARLEKTLDDEHLSDADRTDYEESLAAVEDRMKQLGKSKDAYYAGMTEDKSFDGTLSDIGAGHSDHLGSDKVEIKGNREYTDGDMRDMPVPEHKTGLDMAEHIADDRQTGDIFDHNAFQTSRELENASYRPSLTRDADWKLREAKRQQKFKSLDLSENDVAKAKDLDATTARLESLQAVQAETHSPRSVSPDERQAARRKVAEAEAEYDNVRNEYNYRSGSDEYTLADVQALEPALKQAKESYNKARSEYRELARANRAHEAISGEEHIANQEEIERLTVKKARLEKELADSAVERVANKPKEENTPRALGRKKMAEELARKEAERRGEEGKPAELGPTKVEQPEPEPPKTASEEMAIEKKANDDMAAEAPPEVKEAINKYDENVRRNRDSVSAKRDIRVLTERGSKVFGYARMHGVAKLFGAVDKALFSTVYTRIKRISPYLHDLGSKFGTDHYIRAQDFAARLRHLTDNADRLQKAYDDWVDGTKSLQSTSLRRAFKDIESEVQKVDPTFSFSHAPVVFDLVKMQKKRAELRELLTRAGFKDPDGVIEHLHMNKGVNGPSSYFTGRKETPGKVMGVHRDADLIQQLAPKLREAGFLRTDAPEVIRGVVESTARYMEWGRHFGTVVRNERGQITGFDASVRYRAITDLLHPADAAEMRKLFSAVTGSLGYDLPNWVRSVNAVNFAAIALRYLSFSGVASIPEIAISGARARLGVKDSAVELTKALKQVVLTDRNSLHGMAEGLGILSDMVAHHALLDRYNAGDATIGKTASRLTDYMFKFNQQYRVTDLNSKVAMVMGMNFIHEHGTLAKNGDVRSQHYLKELRISADDAVAGKVDNNQNYQDAVRRFVMESLANPEAGVMPLWMSDPRFAVVASLKKFIYGLFNRVHVGVYQEGKVNGTGAAVATAAGYVVTASALAALSEFTRSMIKQPPFLPSANNGQDKKGKDDWLDTAFKVFSATGLQAHAQLAASPRIAYENDGAGAAFLQALNPTAAWIYSDVLDPNKTWQNKVGSAIPVVDQLPWAKAYLVNKLGVSNGAE